MVAFDLKKYKSADAYESVDNYSLQYKIHIESSAAVEQAETRGLAALVFIVHWSYYAKIHYVHTKRIPNDNNSGATNSCGYEITNSGFFRVSVGITVY